MIQTFLWINIDNVYDLSNSIFNVKNSFFSLNKYGIYIDICLLTLSSQKCPNHLCKICLKTDKYNILSFLLQNLIYSSVVRSYDVGIIFYNITSYHKEINDSRPNCSYDI